MRLPSPPPCPRLSPVPQNRTADRATRAWCWWRPWFYRPYGIQLCRKPRLEFPPRPERFPPNRSCGLAVGTGDSDKLEAPVRMAEDGAARVRQGPANGRHLDPTRGQLRWRDTLTDHRHGAPLQRLRDVSVTVSFFTLNGKEECSRPHVAGVVS